MAVGVLLVDSKVNRHFQTVVYKRKLQRNCSNERLQIFRFFLLINYAMVQRIIFILRN